MYHINSSQWLTIGIIYWPRLKFSLSCELFTCNVEGCWLSMLDDVHQVGGVQSSVTPISISPDRVQQCILGRGQLSCGFIT